MVITLYKSIIPLFFLLASYSSCAQKPVIPFLSRDTVEMIVSDTSITYIIEEEVVTVVEKITAVKPPANYFLSIYFSTLLFAEYKKALPSYEYYLAKVKEATGNLPSYSMGISIWKCPKRISTEYSLSFFRLQQRFTHTYTEAEVDSNQFYPADIGRKQSVINHFNYMNWGFSLGYWFNKTKKLSYVLSGRADICNLLSYSSYTLSKEDLRVASLRNEIKYREFIMDFMLQLRAFYKTNTCMLEITPYLSASPFSSTASAEPYKLYRFMAGLKVGITNKLF